MAEMSHDLFQQFETLANELRGENGQPGDIAARPRQAVDVTGTDRAVL
jgi:hypothetical protein